MAEPDFQSESKPLEIGKLKVPPHSVEAEQSLLGGLMLVNETFDQLIDLVSEEDFFRRENRQIFAAMCALSDRSQPLDAITVSEYLNNHDELEAVGGLAYLGDLASNTASTVNILAYAGIVRERSIMRSLIAASTEITTSAFAPEGRTAEELLDDAERRIMQISDSRQRMGGPRGINEILKASVDRIDELYTSGSSITGLSTGYIDLDNKTSGLQRSDLVIVAGRPSMGKTAFAMNMVEHAAIKQDKPVVVFSMEMPAEALVVRMLSSLGKIDQHRLRNGQLHEEDWPRLNHAASSLKDRGLFIDDTPALSPTEVRSRLRRIIREHGPVAMVVVDYLQLMQIAGHSEGRVAEVSAISRSLKAVAKEFECPMVALSQLNRALEQRPNKRPVMSDLRESGGIEQDADLIAFIYRDEQYNEDTQDKGVAEIIIGKQRNGPTGTVRLAFTKEFTRFDNLAYSDYS